MTSGNKIEKIISVHPIIEPVSAFLLYVAYDGWIFSGRHVWRVDKISLREGRTGNFLSHCKSNEAETVLRSGIPAEFSLMTGDCAVPAIGPDHHYFISQYNIKKNKKPGSHEVNYFPPHVSNEPLNALLPPPPPPPTSHIISLSEKPKVNEFIMDTKVVQLAEAGEDSDNLIQIHDEVAPASVPDQYPLKKTEYKIVPSTPSGKKKLNELKSSDMSTKVEIWDSLAPNVVPNTKRPVVHQYNTNKKIVSAARIPGPNWRQPETVVTPKPESTSFWPGFLDFFGGSSSSSSTARPVILPPSTIQVYSDRQPVHRPAIPYTTSKIKPPISLMSNKDKPQMITLSSNNGTQHQHVTMHHLSSDEQLTILKVDEETDMNGTDGNPLLDDIKKTDDNKTDYIVLHKLPNGEALNLENLETYSSMADVESGIKKTKPQHHPRSLMPHLDYLMPPMEEMIISERPMMKETIYEPIPLDQLDDQEAMPFQDSHPVYIINPLKGDLNVSGEIQPPTEEEVEEAIKQANVELFKINKTAATSPNPQRKEKFLSGVFLNGDPTTPSSTTALKQTTEPSSKHFFETQTVVYEFNWTPIPKRPTFGPARPPPNYKLRADNIKELSHLAHVSVPGTGKLAEEIQMINSSDKPIVNVQLLPPRLSAVLFQVNEKRRSLNHHLRYPGMHRQNKIAPVFKVDPTGLNRKKAKALDHSIFRYVYFLTI